MTPEAEARTQIDALLSARAWVVQDDKSRNLGAGKGIAFREDLLKALIATTSFASIESRPVPWTGRCKPSRSVGFRSSSAHDTQNISDFLTVLTGPRSREMLAFERPEMLRQWLGC